MDTLVVFTPQTIKLTELSIDKLKNIKLQSHFSFKMKNILKMIKKGT